jgi:hypothetical protein
LPYSTLCRDWEIPRDGSEVVHRLEKNKYDLDMPVLVAEMAAATPNKNNRRLPRRQTLFTIAGA